MTPIPPRDERIFTGRWSRVGGTVSDVPGTLTFTAEDGARLKLDGLFDQRATFGGGNQYHTIHGVTDGGEITAFRCLLHSARLLARSPVSEYGSPLMAIGGHFGSYDDLRFRVVTASYFNLEEVIGVTGIEERHTFDAQKMTTTLTYNHPTPLRVQLGPFAVQTEFRATLDGNVFQERGFSQQAAFTIVTVEPTHLQDFLDGPLRSLHNLIVSTRVPPSGR